MPFLIDADGAARIIVRGLARNQGMIAFPWPMTGLRVKLLSRAPKKG